MRKSGYASVEMTKGRAALPEREQLLNKSRRVGDDRVHEFYALASELIGRLPESPLADIVRRSVMHGMQQVSNYSENES